MISNKKEPGHKLLGNERSQPPTSWLVKILELFQDANTLKTQTPYAWAQLGFWGKSQENHRKHYWKNDGNCWVIFMVNLRKRYGQKLRRIILLHFWLITFRFGDGRDRKPLMVMISGFSDVSPSPKTNIICLWRPQDTLTNPRESPNHFWEILCL